MGYRTGREGSEGQTHLAGDMLLPRSQSQTVAPQSLFCCPWCQVGVLGAKGYSVIDLGWGWSSAGESGHAELVVRANG